MRVFLSSQKFNFCLSVVLQPKTKGNEEKPNILVLIAEDISPELGCYGNEVCDYS